MTSILAGLSQAAAVPSDVATGAASAVYVSPQGSDRNDGMTRATPFRTLERAQQALAQTGASDVYLLSGTFPRTAMLTLRTLPRSQRWMADRNAKPVLDGQGRVDAALYIPGHNITVAGLTIRNFRENGIVLESAKNVELTRNTISGIASAGWNKAAILGVQVVEDVRITGNRINNVGYAGIGLFASETGVLTGVVVDNNRLSGTCQRVADCGAIYISGRSRRSRGNVIRGNQIVDYGRAGSDARAIYLDDYLSGTRVGRNVISGCGRYGIHIHGGADNIVVDNVVHSGPGQSAIFFQGGSDRSRGSMATNLLLRNSVAAGRAGGWIEYEGTSAKPQLTGNRVGARASPCAR